MALDTVNLGHILVSDRLHGAILSFLAGKPVVYIDNSYKKLSNVFSTAFAVKETCNASSMGIVESTSSDYKMVVQTIIKMIKLWKKNDPAV